MHASDTHTDAPQMHADDPARDFDFEIGDWHVHNRRLRERLAGCSAWDEFASTATMQLLPGDLGNQELVRASHLPGYVGMALRFFNRATRRWAIHWVDNQRHVLEPPVYGVFVDGTGVFEGDDVFRATPDATPLPIRVRFVWSRTRTATPRWEQAFSADGGATWETNWTMDFRRGGA